MKKTYALIVMLVAFAVIAVGCEKIDVNAPEGDVKAGEVSNDDQQADGGKVLQRLSQLQR